MAAVLVFLLICLTIKVIAKPDPRDQFNSHYLVKPTFFDHEIKQLFSQNLNCDNLQFVKFLNGTESLLELELITRINIFPKDFFVAHQSNGTYVKNVYSHSILNNCQFNCLLLSVNERIYSKMIKSSSQCTGSIENGKVELSLFFPQDEIHIFFHDYLKQHLLLYSVNESTQFKNVNEDEIFVKNEAIFRRNSRQKRNTEIFGFHNVTDKTRFIELIIVNDYKEFEAYKKDKDVIVDRSKSIVNHVNTYFNLVNIYVILVGVVIWNEKDEIEMSDNSSLVLEHFLKYRRDVLIPLHPNDNAQLISGQSFTNGTVGKALLGPICSTESSGGINTDHVHLASLVAATVAHELGHNFGLNHDTSNCSCPDVKCVMSESSGSFRPRFWSNCSIQSFESAFKRGLDSCMLNQPKLTFANTCGNGVLEENEQCDCGTSAFCKQQKCCDMNQCKLTVNSTCGTGVCCDFNTCKPISLDEHRICRPLQDQCDFIETCDGHDEFCPKDLFAHNGIPCSVNDSKAYCFDGKCRTHQSQCKLLWGETAMNAENICYRENQKATIAANCGRSKAQNNSSMYVKCAKEDIFCGRLHCKHNSERLKYGWHASSNQLIIKQGNVVICSSALLDLGVKVIDPGLVPNGAKCGENHMCVNQRCIKIPEKLCEENCYNNGICANDGSCVCLPGYYAPYCKHNLWSRIVLIFYIFVLGILPGCAILYGLFLYFREDIKTWWFIKTRKAIIRSRVNQSIRQRKNHPSTKSTIINLKNIEISQPVPIDVASSSTFTDIRSSTTCNPISKKQEQIHLKPIRPAPPPPRIPK